jgi:uncharacterized protein YggE
MVARLTAAFLLTATILVGVQAVKSLMDIDTSPSPAVNTISVSGMGKVSASPDIATVSFTVSQNGDTASQAQDAATKKSNVALGVVKDLGVAEKDVKTTSYNLSPRYNYTPCYGGYCPQPESRIIGYTVSQTVEVKIRDLDKVGTVLASLGDAGVSNLYGPNFTVDKEEEVQAKARKAAIQDARAKANALAKDLGVRIIRVVNFSEGGGGGPIFYAKAMASADSAGAPPTPEIPAGENEIVSNVSVTYEIR